MFDTAKSLASESLQKLKITLITELRILGCFLYTWKKKKNHIYLGWNYKHFLEISLNDCIILSAALSEVLQGCVNDPRKIFIVLFPG